MLYKQWQLSIEIGILSNFVEMLFMVFSTEMITIQI